MLSEETIMRHLDRLLSSSEPGAELHHLYVVEAPMGAVGPLRLLDEEKTHLSVYAILPTGNVDPERFTMQVVVAAAVEADKRDNVIVFAGLSQEVFAVEGMDDLGRRLGAEHRLGEHPRAVEMTMVYAACRDGRRWTGVRWLTGERAGTTGNVRTLVGGPDRREGSGMVAASALRRLVGLTF